MNLKKFTTLNKDLKMEKKLQTFLQSDMLDRYIMGTTSVSEDIQIEHYIETYPEVADEYLRLQDNLEIIAKSNAVEAPKFILDAIHSEIEKDSVITMTTERASKTPWFSIAASILVLVFAGYSFMLHQENLELKQENDVVVEEIFDLRSDIDKNNSKLDEVMRQFLKLNNPETEKYVLRGNERAKDLKTVAYINAVDKTSMIDVVSLPQLPKNQNYQIWAEMQDRMVNLGILDPSDRKLQQIPYMENALGLSITIEPQGGQSTTTDNSVAEITLKN